jgi:hypothetical protein
MSKAIAITKLILGIVVIIAGIFLIAHFWKEFLIMLKGVIGLIIAFIGLILAMIGYFDLQE